MPQRRNTIKGKNKRKGSNKATGRNYDYQREYNARPEQKKKRAELNRENRKRKTYGNKDGKDVSHNSDGSIKRKAESQSKNRARNKKGSRKP